MKPGLRNKSMYILDPTGERRNVIKINDDVFLCAERYHPYYKPRECGRYLCCIYVNNELVALSSTWKSIRQYLNDVLKIKY